MSSTTCCFVWSSLSFHKKKDDYILFSIGIFHLTILKEQTTHQHKFSFFLSLNNYLHKQNHNIMITHTKTNTNKYSCPSASLDYIIEPWFLGPGSTSPGGPEFNEWADASKSTYGTVFASSIKDLPEPKEPRCALISGRTADNPRLFGECIEAGCKTIFLEKPGAPTVRKRRNR